jgi:hypothetical protein
VSPGVDTAGRREHRCGRSVSSRGVGVQVDEQPPIGIPIGELVGGVYGEGGLPKPAVLSTPGPRTGLGVPLDGADDDRDGVGGQRGYTGEQGRLEAGGGTDSNGHALFSTMMGSRSWRAPLCPQ